MNRSTMTPMLLMSACLILPSGSQAEPPPTHVSMIHPAEGAHVPRSSLVHFSTEGGPKNLSIELPEQERTLVVEETAIANAWGEVGAFWATVNDMEPGPVALIVGPELEEPRVLTWTVDEAYDVTPPEPPGFELAPWLTMANDCEAPRGFTVPIQTEPYVDDFGILTERVEFHATPYDDEESPWRGWERVPGEYGPGAMMFPLDAEELCVRITVTDLGGNETVSDLACTNLQPLLEGLKFNPVADCDARPFTWNCEERGFLSGPQYTGELPFGRMESCDGEVGPPGAADPHGPHYLPADDAGPGGCACQRPSDAPSRTAALVAVMAGMLLNRRRRRTPG